MNRLIQLTKLATIASAIFAASLTFSQAVRMGNGSENWITTEGVTREDSILTFSEVRINGNGWLVIHPFENGVPNGDKYVAATYLKSGINSDVAIEVIKGLAPGENFIVMLHRDSNENGVFDFMFVDDENVVDLAVFEGSTMIGHAIAAP